MKLNFTLEGMATGLGLALAATVLLPVAKTVARPLVAAGVQGVSALGNTVKNGVTYVKEEMEDLVAEAQWERMKQSIDQDILH
jgi:hypothetical protein